MNLTGPGPTGVTVFTQRLLKPDVWIPTAVLTTRFLSVIHTLLVLIKSAAEAVF